MRRKKIRAPWVGILLLASLLLFAAGDIGAGVEQAGMVQHGPGTNGSAPPDTLFGGPWNPGGENGDPNDYDIWIPITLWFGRWILIR